MSLKSVLVLSAIEQELFSIKKNLVGLHTVSQGVWQGDWSNTCIYLSATSMGRDNARVSAEKLLAKFKPSLCVMIGYCGALSPSLKVGDLVISSEIILEEEKEALINPNHALNSELVIDLRESVKSKNLALTEGRTFTSSKVIESSIEKNELFKKWGVLSVDMEAGEILKACNRVEIPFVSLKWVVDTANQELPHFNLEFLRSGKMDHESYLSALKAQPQLAKPLIDNGRHAQEKMALMIGDVLNALVRVC